MGYQMVPMPPRGHKAPFPGDTYGRGLLLTPPSPPTTIKLLDTCHAMAVDQAKADTKEEA